MSDINDYTNQIHTGDATETLSELPDSSVHMMMTSPPYFGLRDYGVDGQIGLEESLDEYIAELVDVFREVRRVLRPDGSAWLNLGDSYAGSGRGSWEEPTDDVKESYVPSDLPERNDRLGRKNKMLVPHRVAIALQDDGWIVRNDVTWVKPNPMPSSVKDRLNTTTEQVFHLTPEPDYWYDLDAIREPHSERSIERMSEGPVNANTDGRGTNDDLNPDQLCDPAGKNPGDVFEVTTKPFPEAHFAVYPPELVEKPLKATCPPRVCAECGAPYEREVEDSGLAGEAKIQDGERPAADERDVSDSSLLRTNGRTWRDREHVGWRQPCDCDTDTTEAGIALDPFAGAGTTCLVAKEHARRFIGIDLNPEYVAMAQQRLGLTVENPEYVRDDAEAGLGAFTDGGAE